MGNSQVLQKITPSIPFLSALLISCGYWNMYIFYQFFDIPINSFISAEEIIFSFFPILIQFFFIAIILLFFWLINLNEEKTNWVELDSPIKHTFNKVLINSKIIFKKNKLSSKLGAGIEILSSLAAFAFLYMLTAILIINLFNNSISTTAGYWTYFFAVSIWSLTFIDIIHKKIYKSTGEKYKNYSAVIRLIYVIIIFISSNFISSYAEAKDIFNGKNDMTVEFNYEGKEIKSDKRLVYIGSTKSSIFLWDRKNARSFIYQTDKISNIKISSKKN